MKRITAILAILATMALTASPALAGNKFSPMKPTSGVAAYPYRSGHLTRVLFGHHTYRIMLSTWS